jgi:hypothetical protein
LIPGFPTAASTEGVGDPNANFRAGLSNSFSYKGLSLNVLFDSSVGGDLWDGTNAKFKNNRICKYPKLICSRGCSSKRFKRATAQSQGVLNADGSYSVRGNIADFGAGPNQSWYSGLGEALVRYLNSS